MKSANQLSPSKWWKTLNKTCLSKIAVALLDAPPTSAATERSFSTQGWIHSSKRNRLATDRSIKLTYITHNLKLLSTNNKKPKTNFEEDEDGSTEYESEYDQVFATIGLLVQLHGG